MSLTAGYDAPLQFPAALAGLASRSESWLSQVQRGLRQVDSHSLLVSLADILHVDVGEQAGDEPGDLRVSQYWPDTAA